MQNKIKLTVIFVIFLSLHALSQTTEKSTHPKLDKYYPRPENTTPNPVVTPQIKTAPVTVPVSETVEPVVATKPAIQTLPAITPDTATIINQAPVTAIDKPTIATPSPQVQKQKISGQPEPPIYRDTRLGSSSKKYDTWEKNNNGAGSVTTGSK